MWRSQSWKIVKDHLIAELLRLNRSLEDFRARGRRVSMFHKPKVKVVKLIPIESLYNLAIYFVFLSKEIFFLIRFDQYNCGKKYLTRILYVSRSMLQE